MLLPYYPSITGGSIIQNFIILGFRQTKHYIDYCKEFVINIPLNDNLKVKCWGIILEIVIPKLFIILNDHEILWNTWSTMKCKYCAIPNYIHNSDIILNIASIILPSYVMYGKIFWRKNEGNINWSTLFCWTWAKKTWCMSISEKYQIMMGKGKKKKDKHIIIAKLRN